jgi:hypothetical protein
MIAGGRPHTHDQPPNGITKALFMIAPDGSGERRGEILTARLNYCKKEQAVTPAPPEEGDEKLKMGGLARSGGTVSFGWRPSRPAHKVLKKVGGQQGLSPASFPISRQPIGWLATPRRRQQNKCEVETVQPLRTRYTTYRTRTPVSTIADLALSLNAARQTQRLHLVGAGRATWLLKGDRSCPLVHRFVMGH